MSSPPVSGGEDGMTIIELMVSMFIFALAATSSLLVLNSSHDLTRNDRSRSVAANLAAREMDIVRSTDFASLPMGALNSSQVVDGVTYSVVRTSSWVNGSSSNGATCSGTTGGTGTKLLRVTVAVTWPNMKGTAPVTSQTVLAPPPGNSNGNTGAVGVSITDRTGAATAGRTVTVSGPGGTQTKSTGSDGCAVFTGLAPGQYTVSLLDSGYVDTQGNPNPSQTTSITASTTSIVQFTYDRAASLVLTLSGGAGVVVPPAVGVTVANDGLLPLGFMSVAGTGTPRTVSNLFPFPNGYQVWGGDCADADPQATTPDGSSALYPGAQRGAALATAPGGSSSGTVTLAPALVHVTRANGSVVSGATLQFIHAADAACPSGDSLSAGTTDASGNLTVGLPLGTWTVQVQGSAPATSWPTVSLAPGSAAPTVNVVITTACSSPGSQTLLSTADTALLQQYPTTNYGTSSIYYGVQSQTSQNARSLVSFTLPAAPSGCVLQSAQLRVYDSYPTAGRTIQVLQVASSWSETGATWTNQPATSGTAASATAAAGWMQWTVTSMVQAMYSGSNYGFLLRDAAENNASLAANGMSPREGANDPQLVLTWG